MTRRRQNFRLRYLVVACPECRAVVGDECDVGFMGAWIGFDDGPGCHVTRALRAGAVEEAMEC